MKTVEALLQINMNVNYVKRKYAMNVYKSIMKTINVIETTLQQQEK
jgi:hypothetical protein